LGFGFVVVVEVVEDEGRVDEEADADMDVETCGVEVGKHA
jgi:hypothetical protein